MTAAVAMRAAWAAEPTAVHPAWEGLHAGLAALADRLASAPRTRDRPPPTWMVRAWLESSGVTGAGDVPIDVLMWMEWVARHRGALSTARAPWRLLPLDAALDARIALQARGGPDGAWLPLVVSAAGDHQIYLPRSPRHGVVVCLYSDEPAANLAPLVGTAALRPSARPLVHLVHALAAAWPRRA